MKKYFFQWRNTSLFLAMLLITYACDLINPDEDIPAYIKPQHAVVEGSEGPVDYKINDVWVNIGSKSYGAYEIPAIIPLLEEGEHEIILKAGIKLNGMSATRIPYPLYKSVKKTVFLLPGETVPDLDTLVFSYLDDLALPFPFEDDFEGSLNKFEKASNSDTTIFKTTNQDEIYPDGGYQSGKIVLDTAHKYFEIVTQDYLNNLPDPGAFLFLELNFKNDIPIDIGVYAIYSSFVNDQYVVSLSESSDWNKIYVNLSEVIIDNAQAIGIKLYFRGALESSGLENAEVLLDNIKVLYQDY